MVFLPMVPPPRPPSGRALDLGRRLKAEVERFEQQYPGTSREDLRAAAGIAIGEESATVPVQRRVRAAALGLVVAVGGLGVMLKTAESAGGGPSGAAAPYLIIGMACIGAIVVAVVVRRARG